MALQRRLVFHVDDRQLQEHKKRLAEYLRMTGGELPLSGQFDRMGQAADRAAAHADAAGKSFTDMGRAAGRAAQEAAGAGEQVGRSWSGLGERVREAASRLSGVGREARGAGEELARAGRVPGEALAFSSQRLERFARDAAQVSRAVAAALKRSAQEGSASYEVASEQAVQALRKLERDAERELTSRRVKSKLRLVDPQEAEAEMAQIRALLERATLEILASTEGLSEGVSRAAQSALRTAGLSAEEALVATNEQIREMVRQTQQAAAQPVQMEPAQERFQRFAQTARETSAQVAQALRSSAEEGAKAYQQQIGRTIDVIRTLGRDARAEIDLIRARAQMGLIDPQTAERQIRTVRDSLTRGLRDIAGAAKDFSPALAREFSRAMQQAGAAVDTGMNRIVQKVQAGAARIEQIRLRGRLGLIDTRQAEAEVDKLQSRLRAFVTRSRADIATLSPALQRDLVAALDKAGVSFEAGERRAGRFGESLQRIRTWALAAATALGVLLARSVLKLSGEFEQTRTAFVTLLGDAQRADAFLRELFQFAARTPFEIRGIRDIARSLLTLKLEGDQVIRVMNAVGNATAALGGGTPEMERIVLQLRQMHTLGRVTTEDLRRLSDVGIAAFEILADKLGKTQEEVANLIRKGLIPGRVAFEALVQGMEERFGGAMEAQSRTLFGLISTLKDQAQLFLVEGATGLTAAIRADLEELVNSFNRMSQSGQMADWARRLDETLTFVYRTVRNVVRAFVEFSPVIVRLGAVLLPLVAAWKTYNAVITAATALSVVYARTLASITAAKLAYTAAVRGATGATVALNVATKATPWGILLGVLAAVATAWVVLRDRTNEAAEAIRRNRDQHREAIQDIREMGGAMLYATEQARKETQALAELELQAARTALAQVETREFKPQRMGQGANMVVVTPEQQREQARTAAEQRLSRAAVGLVYATREQEAAQDRINGSLSVQIEYLEAAKAKQVEIAGASGRATEEIAAAKEEIVRLNQELETLKARQRDLEGLGLDFDLPEDPELQKAQQALEAIRRSIEQMNALTEERRRLLGEIYETTDRLRSLEEAGARLGSAAVQEERQALQDRLEDLRAALALEGQFREAVRQGADAISGLTLDLALDIDAKDLARIVRSQVEEVTREAEEQAALIRATITPEMDPEARRTAEEQIAQLQEAAFARVQALMEKIQALMPAAAALIGRALEQGMTSLRVPQEAERAILGRVRTLMEDLRRETERIEIRLAVPGLSDEHKRNLQEDLATLKEFTAEQLKAILAEAETTLPFLSGAIREAIKSGLEQTQVPPEVLRSLQADLDGVLRTLQERKIRLQAQLARGDIDLSAFDREMERASSEAKANLEAVWKSLTPEQQKNLDVLRKIVEAYNDLKSEAGDALQGVTAELARTEEALRRVADAIESVSDPTVESGGADEAQQALEAYLRTVQALKDEFSRGAITGAEFLQGADQAALKAHAQMERLYERMKALGQLTPEVEKAFRNLQRAVSGALQAELQRAANRFEFLSEATRDVLRLVDAFGDLSESMRHLGQGLSDWLRGLSQIKRIQADILETQEKIAKATSAEERRGLTTQLQGLELSQLGSVIGLAASAFSAVKGFADALNARRDEEQRAREEQIRAMRDLQDALRRYADALEGARRSLLEAGRVGQDVRRSEIERAVGAVESIEELRRTGGTTPPRGGRKQFSEAEQQAFFGQIDVLQQTGLFDFDLRGYFETLLEKYQGDFNAAMQEFLSGQASRGFQRTREDFAGVAEVVRDVEAQFGQFGKSIEGAREQFEFFQRFLGEDAPQAFKRFADFLLENVKGLDPVVQALLEEAKALDLSTEEDRARFQEIFEQMARDFPDLLGDLSPEEFQAVLDVFGTVIADFAQAVDRFQRAFDRFSDAQRFAERLGLDPNQVRDILIEDLRGLGDVVSAALLDVLAGLDLSTEAGQEELDRLIEQLMRAVLHGTTEAFGLTEEEARHLIQALESLSQATQQAALSLTRFSDAQRFAETLGLGAGQLRDILIGELKGISDAAAKQLAGIDVASPQGQEQLRALIRAVMQAVLAGTTQQQFGLSAEDARALIGALEALQQAAQPKGEFTRSVQIARSITEIQANEFIAIAETQLFELRKHSSLLRVIAEGIAGGEIDLGAVVREATEGRFSPEALSVEGMVDLTSRTLEEMGRILRESLPEHLRAEDLQPLIDSGETLAWIASTIAQILDDVRGALQEALVRFTRSERETPAEDQPERDGRGPTRPGSEERRTSITVEAPVLPALHVDTARLTGLGEEHLRLLEQIRDVLSEAVRPSAPAGDGYAVGEPQMPVVPIPPALQAALGQLRNASLPPLTEPHQMTVHSSMSRNFNFRDINIANKLTERDIQYIMEEMEQALRSAEFGFTGRPR